VTGLVKAARSPSSCCRIVACHQSPCLARCAAGRRQVVKAVTGGCFGQFVGCAFLWAILLTACAPPGGVETTSGDPRLSFLEENLFPLHSLLNFLFHFFSSPSLSYTLHLTFSPACLALLLLSPSGWKFWG